MSTDSPSLQKALACYQAGRYQDAERLYCDVLRRDPDNADALHLLGLLYLDGGQPQPAAALISRAIQRQPDAPFYYNTLGIAFRVLGKHEQSRVCFQKAIALKPDYGEAFSNLGSVLEESGQVAEAIVCHERAATLMPGSAEVHGNLGNALRSAGRPAEASAEYQIALGLRPGYAEAWMNLGNIYFDREDFPRAEEQYRKALRLHPRLAEAQTNLGSTLCQLGHFQEAEAWCRKALETLPGNPLALSNLASLLVVTERPEAGAQACRQALAVAPAMAEAHGNLGIALARMHQLEEAEWHCRESVRLRPGRPTGHVHLASVLLLKGRFEEAEACLNVALELHAAHGRALSLLGDLRAARQDYAGALGFYNRVLELYPGAWYTRFSRAVTRLTLGDFERGWDEYECRWMRGDCQPERFAQPDWDGSPFPGKTVLLYTEQGLGDTLQFVRFLPLVKRLGGMVVLACQPLLLPILFGVEGVDRVVSKGGEVPESDYQLPLMSLPRVLGTREETIPRDVPYLKVPGEAVERARKRLLERCGEEDGRLRVGVVWAGSARHAADTLRSIPLEQLGRLRDVPGAQLVSLQQDGAIPVSCPLIPVLEASDDIATTAAILQQLDLIVTVDTMMAHLAGALGRPVWTLLQFAGDWRWMMGRADSPWYPTMRLFRQSRFGDWEGVLEQVRGELSGLGGP